MGITYADITLTNSGDAYMAKEGVLPRDKVRTMEVRALVDSGAMTLIINEMLADQLGLDVENRVSVALADGSLTKCDLVGPVTIRFKNRMTFCQALVIPGADEVLLGVIPMEGMDVMIDPKTEQLILPPDRPYVACLKAK